MSAESHPLIQIVDHNDVPLRGGTMDEAQLNGLWHRMTGVMVQDIQSGNFLLQKIAPNPYYNGGKWNLTSTGHVDEGEDYHQAAERELFEEMGIAGLTLVEWDRYETEKIAHRADKDRIYRRKNVIFLSRATARTMVLKPDKVEVEDTIWRSFQELQVMSQRQDPPMTDALLRFTERFRDGD